MTTEQTTRQHTNEQREIRISKLDQIRALGYEPFGNRFEWDHTSGQIIENADALEQSEAHVRLTGRIMIVRDHGKTAFLTIRDSVGDIQLYIRQDTVSEKEWQLFHLLDRGDILGVEGVVFRTHSGEVTVRVETYTILTKALRPLPDKWHGLTDKEQRYRMRYVDLIMNPEVRKAFVTRTKMLAAIRQYYTERGFLEVETPVLQPLYGGANARPFISHLNALDMTMYLRIAPELYLKRLIVGGFEGVYEIGKNFRNEGMDRTHNPEFTCVELYVQYKDYNWMMEFTERMLEQICIAVNGKPETEIDGKVISFKAPYRRLPILDAIKEETGYDLNSKSEEEIRSIAEKLGIEVDETMGKGKLIDEIFGETCEGKFIQPTFITDYPVEMSPLTKMHRSKPGLTERFELMVNGKELANAYSELNDPIDQEERFVEQMRLADKGDDEAMLIDQDFLRALQYGMPPTSGIGIGIDRLVMLLTGNTTIQEVLFFPQMKPEKLPAKDKVEAYLPLGIPAELVPVLQKVGYYLVQDLKDANPQKIQQQMGEVIKKYQLEITKPSVADIAAWIEALGA